MTQHVMLEMSHLDYFIMKTPPIHCKEIKIADYQIRNYFLIINKHPNKSYGQLFRFELPFFSSFSLLLNCG